MEQKQNQQAQQNEQQVAQQMMQPIVKATDSKEFLLSSIGQQIKKFELTQRMALVYTNSTLVPKQYQGVQNTGNVMIALEMSERIGANPLLVMQNLYVVYGNPSWSSKFLIASFNQSGRYTPIRYEEKGKKGTDEWGMRAYAYELSDKNREHRLEGPWVTIAIAKAEGWYNKSGSKWQTMPELMLHYRSAAQFINTVAPEISMGLRTVEEVEDTHTIEDADFTEVPSQPQFASFEEEDTAKTDIAAENEKKSDDSKQGKATDAKTLFG